MPRASDRWASGGIVAGGPVVWHGDPDGLFQVGSVTKVFTSLLLATYVVDGALALDDPVARLLPELADAPAAGITLEQLATHTSGLPRVPGRLWRRSFGHPDPYADLDHASLVGDVRALSPRPRRRPAYSNLGAALLGEALATWAGGTYEELVGERICAPLGLDATTCHPAQEPVGTGRRGSPKPGTWHFTAYAGAGALWSTLADLQRFLAAQLERPAGDLGEAIRLTHQVRVPGKRMDQCLGWLRLHGCDDGPALLWHNGGTAGYRSFVGLQDTGAVTVLSATDRSVDRLGMQLLRDLG